MLIGPDSRCLRLLTSQQETVSKRPGLVIEASPVIVDEKGNTITDAPAMPPLTERQEQEAEDRTSVSALVVHEAIRKDGDEELRRSISALGLVRPGRRAFDGVLVCRRSFVPHLHARGSLASVDHQSRLSAGLSNRHRGTPAAYSPRIRSPPSSRCWRAAIMTTFWQVLRLWAVVLTANIAGAHIFAWVIGNTPVLHPQVSRWRSDQLATEAADVSFGTAILRGIFAGWLIAMVVWMLAATDSNRIPIIILMTYIVGLAGLTHIVAGSVEVLFLVMTGAKSWLSCRGRLHAPDADRQRAGRRRAGLRAESCAGHRGNAAG